jgi:hypothetical protein
MRMRRTWLFAAMAVGLAICKPALACRALEEVDLDSVRSADIVLVGRIFDYRGIRNEDFRRRMLDRPNLSVA